MSVTPSTGPLPASPSRLPGTFWLALPLFGALLWLGLRAHELWRDETQAWAVARDSGSLFQLLATGIRYEGHPPLWYCLLYTSPSGTAPRSAAAAPRPGSTSWRYR